MTHAVFTATAYVFADTKHNLNQDIQAKTCIAHTVFVSNKANLKSDEEPKQLPGLETSTLHFLNAKDSDGSSMEKKVEWTMNGKHLIFRLNFPPNFRLNYLRVLGLGFRV